MIDSDSQKKLTIVLIEDNDLNIEAAKTQLEEHDLLVFKKYSDFEEFLKKQLTEVCNEMQIGEKLTSELVHPMSFARLVSICRCGLKHKIDMLLTDNEIPAQPRQIKENQLPEKIGSSIVLIGLMLKIPMIGLLTDRDHHADAHSAIFDCLGGSSEIVLSMGDSKVIISSIHNTRISDKKDAPKVKNWKALLDCLTSTEK